MISACSGGDPAPDAAGQPAQEEGRDDRDDEHADEDAAECVRRHHDHQQPQRDRAGQRPAEQLRELVDRQVAQGSVIAVIEPLQLGEEHPDRDTGERG